MQVIYQQGAASNIAITAQKRLIRLAYGSVAGFPYAAWLDPSLRNSDNSIRIPQSTDETPTYPLTRSANAFTYEGSLVPGTVLVHTTDEYAAVANGAASITPWGLLGQWVGGNFDNLGQNNNIGVWQGVDATVVLLAPAWDDTGVAAAIAGAGAGSPVMLYGGTDGRLSLLESDGGTAAADSVPVARIVERVSAAQLIIQLVI